MAGGALSGVEVAGGGGARRGALPAAALALLARLERETRDRRGALLRRRLERQATFAAGMRPSFAAATRRLRGGEWKVALAGMRFEPVVAPPDAHAAKLRDSAAFEPRVVVDGRPVGAALYDLVAVLHARIAAGAAPPHRLRLPAQESHLEARLWSEVLRTTQEEWSLPAGSLAVVIAVEALPALFELDEMLWELQPFAAAFELDRTELARSTIEKLGDDPTQLAPDLDALLALHPAATAALTLVAATARRRGVTALLAPTMPAPDLADPSCGPHAAAQCAEFAAAAQAGYAGFTVAEPALAELAERTLAGERPPAKAATRATAPPAEATVELAERLVAAPTGPRTAADLAATLDALLAFEAAPPGTLLLRCAGRLENAASAALRRAVVLQWLRHAAPLDDGGDVTPERVRAELDSLAGDGARAAAARLAERLGLPA